MNALLFMKLRKAGVQMAAYANAKGAIVLRPIVYVPRHLPASKRHHADRSVTTY